MPKTSDRCELCKGFRITRFNSEGEPRTTERQYKNIKKGCIHKWVFDKYIKDLMPKKWYSEQELKDKLKEAEKRIDEQQLKGKEEYVDGHNRGLDKAKQILNDCFGVGK